MSFESVDELISTVSALGLALTAQGLHVQATGGAAVALLVPDVAALWGRANRPMPGDIDLLAPGRQRMRLAASLTEMGWRPDEHRNAIHGRVRHIYARQDGVGLDVFFDALRMCHEIPMTRSRVGTSIAVPVEDLLLHKLQIVELNAKDFIDLAALFLAVAEGRLQFSSDRLQIRTNRDWGLWVTTVANLERIMAARNELYWLSKASADAVITEVSELVERLRESRKTPRWRARAIVGKRMPWYEEVEEVDR